jgi:hypothetical protein
MARSVEKSGINVLPASRRDASLRDAKEVGACDFSTERPIPTGWQDKAFYTNHYLKKYIVLYIISILQTKTVKIFGGVDLSSEQQESLAAGETIKIENATNKAGQKQTVYVRWNTEKGSPEFF